LLRVLALASAGPLAWIGATALARVAPVLLMRVLPMARQDGLGHQAGRPTKDQVFVAALIGGIALAVTTPTSLALPVALGCAGFVLIGVSRRACRLVGGQTGDVLGAACLLVETGTLIGIACVL
jgi:adenosylcobinamide-GDP ribazoletransferase